MENIGTEQLSMFDFTGAIKKEPPPKPKQMKVLIAREESQRVCTAFRDKGHEAYSADIQDCSGGHPEWHIKGDVLPLINGHCLFNTVDGKRHIVGGAVGYIDCPPALYISHGLRRDVAI